jgi:Zn finger protein HypA/HybF involved in hydrogenase expression
MKSAAERLAMLASRGVDLEHVPGGGAPAFTWADMAAAIGMGHNPLGSALVMVKYSGYQDTGAILKTGWRMVVGEYAMKQKWDRKPAGTMFALADYVLLEALGSGRCTSCHGVAHAVVNQKHIECPACHGTGLHSPTDHAISRELGLSVADYRNRWSARLAWARHEIHRLEYEALAALDEALE